MENVTDMTISEFAEALSTSDPVPGGGSVSAYVGALAAALSGMVASLTSGKKKYAEHQKEIEEIIKQSSEQREKLMKGIERDIKCFEPLAETYRLPANTPEEKAKKEEILEEKLLIAAEAPLILMSDIIDALKTAVRLADIGSKIVISDVGVAVFLADAAVSSAGLNVFINTKLMKDRDKAKEINTVADSLINESFRLRTEVLPKILMGVRDDLI